MSFEEIWQPVIAALDRTAELGRSVEIWLRDDDAVTHTPALERLAALGNAYDMPILLAVIPGAADASLAAFVSSHPGLMPVQHGLLHTNHAAQGERAQELGGMRPVEAIIDDLRRGRNAMDRLFPSVTTDILVPPWNRIDRALPPLLPSLGYSALSTFGPATTEIDGLTVLNADLDIIDWRNGQVCRPHAGLAGKLATLLDDRLTTPGPIGLLTHHLVHEEPAWDFMNACLAKLRTHPAARFEAARHLIGRKSGSDRLPG